MAKRDFDVDVKSRVARRKALKKRAARQLGCGVGKLRWLNGVLMEDVGWTERAVIGFGEVKKPKRIFAEPKHTPAPAPRDNYHDVNAGRFGGTHYSGGYTRW